VAAASIDTGNGRRDRHLRSADFLDAGCYPDIIFTLDGNRPSGHGVAVTGTLTVRGRTWPLSFDVAASVQGHAEICLDAEGGLNRADFGLTWNVLGLVPANSTVIVHALFARW
jgi:polyisoprenoid-binding protein YceI